MREMEKETKLTSNAEYSKCIGATLSEGASKEV